VVIERGDVVWVDFGAPTGSAPALRRPAVVVQAGALNRTAINTVLVVPLTSNVTLARFPQNVLIPDEVAALSRESVALVAQVTTVDRAEVSDPVGRVPSHLMRQIDRGLRLALEL
jgi:mRNA interferase MazF